MRNVQAVVTLFALRTAPSRLLVGGVTVVVLAAGAWVSFAPAAPNVRHLNDSFPVGNVRVAVERFEPVGGGRHPGVVLLHGIDGLWRMGDAYRGCAGRLADKGFVVVLPHYFDRTDTRPGDVPVLLRNFRRYIEDGEDRPEQWQKVQRPFEDWLEVVRAGVLYSRGLDSVADGRVGLVGVSLGGYLALSAASDGELHVGAVVDHFGGMPRDVRKTVRTMPPALLLHGDRDRTVPVREAYLVRDALLGHQLSCEIKVYEGVGHVYRDDHGGMTWTGTRALLDAEERTASFLNRHLRTQEAAGN